MFSTSVLSLVLGTLILSPVVILSKDVTITVGANVKNSTTVDPATIFDPQTVDAKAGDRVVFNFEGGNFTVIQSTFAQPCIDAHTTDPTINAFDSGPRNTVNGTAVTTLPVDIPNNKTIWFYEATFCAQGGLGAINVDSSSNETFTGYTENAARLFGNSTSGSNSTSTTTSGSSTSTGTGTDTGTAGASPSSKSGSNHVAWLTFTQAIVIATLASSPFILC